MTLLGVSLIFFIAAAAGGPVLARSHLNPSVEPPGLLVVGHPLLAASGLILLGGAVVRSGGTTTLAAALVLLVLAAAAGIGLATLRVRRGRAPVGWIGLHAVLALTGVALILLELFAGEPGVPPPIEGGTYLPQGR